MGHHHDHHRVHGSQKHLATAFFLNLGFAIIELIGGWWTNSVAIQSDALHDLGDSFALGLAWYFQRLGKRGSDAHFTFGYRRFNTLGAVITSIVLLAGSVFILFEAVPRLWNAQPVHVPGMMGLAVMGLLVNGMAVWQMRQGGKSLNEEMMTWHLLEDLLGWFAILIGSIIMYFWNIPWIDPLLSIGISLFILYHVAQTMWRAMKILLQAIPDPIVLEEVKKELEGLEEIRRAHHLHLWTLDGDYHLFTGHLKVDDQTQLSDLQQLRTSIAQRLLERFGIDHVTLEFEAEEVADQSCPPAHQCHDHD